MAPETNGVHRSLGAALAAGDDRIRQLLLHATPEELEQIDRLLNDPLLNFEPWAQAISPKLSWHMPHLRYLNRQLERLTNGEIKRLAIAMPPRHGKTTNTTIHYPVWRLERDPTLRICIVANNQNLANDFSSFIRALAARRIPLSMERRAVKGWRTLAGGIVRACGIGAPPVGEGFNLLIIDDPIRKRVEADNPATLDKIYKSYVTDFHTRLEPNAAILLIATRWREDDLTGRLIALEDPDERFDLVSFPALAEENDLLGRAVGEALWPERWSAKVLRAKQRMNPVEFAALYQQRPAPAEGILFKTHKIRYWKKAAPHTAVRTRYWDKAGSEGTGAYSTGVLMARWKHVYVVEDVVRGQWSAHERNEVIQATAREDADKYDNEVQIMMEQEPGSGGKESAEISVRQLSAFPVKSQLATGDKETRARPFASQVEAGNVFLVEAPWNGEYLYELKTFPNGKYKDQVDASSGAYNSLALGFEISDLSMGEDGDTSWLDAAEEMAANLGL